jgi:zeaxanthin glucosyltransferase
MPPALPDVFTPSAQEVADLRTLCETVSEAFTETWNSALVKLAPARTASENAFAEHGDLLVHNYPEELVPAERLALLPTNLFIGASLREESPEARVDDWLASSDEPFVYVSFGSFLSVRDDVLARVVGALKQANIRAAIATGSADVTALGSLPNNWLVAEFLPQITLLKSAALAVTHGGNNSVTEALTWGVPLVVLPFSTDQFAGAEALERVGFGTTLAPNDATVAELKDAIEHMLNMAPENREALHDLGRHLRQREGHQDLIRRFLQ